MSGTAAPPPLRPADAVRSRAAVLARLLARQAAEAGTAAPADGRRDDGPPPEEATLDEHMLLTMPSGSWDAETVERVSWEREALGVLGWALGWVDSIPPYDVGFRTDQVLAAFAAHGSAAEVAYARPESAVRAARDLAEAWHWRVRTTAFEDEMRAEGMDPVEVVRDAAGYLRDNAGLATLDGDYAAYGKPFRDLDPSEFDTVVAITLQRHGALNWVCGIADTWDERASMTT
jgi:hypothetical protein